MSAIEKTNSTPDAATRELWRAAELDDVEALEIVLPLVPDINAQNEHGMTALMRAAQNGHAKIVRLLLEHGADANIVRNDKFTALALAAFFGYTEIVRTLMEHGADSQASTRSGTSPHIWAKARTFNEVVDQLENRVATKPPVVKTLKDPPEIWDLVHEVPRGFNARSAFLARIGSIKADWAFRLASVVVLIVVGTLGVLVLRAVQARNAIKPQPQPAASIHTIAASSETPVNNSSLTPVPAATPISVEKPVAQTLTRRSHRSAPRLIESNTSPQVAIKETVQPPGSTTEKLETRRSSESTSKTKPNSPLSPQLIAPAKSATAPKAKVIQWP